MYKFKVMFISGLTAVMALSMTACGDSDGGSDAKTKQESVGGEGHVVIDGHEATVSHLRSCIPVDASFQNGKLVRTLRTDSGDIDIQVSLSTGARLFLTTDKPMAERLPTLPVLSSVSVSGLDEASYGDKSYGWAKGKPLEAFEHDLSHTRGKATLAATRDDDNMIEVSWDLTISADAVDCRR